MTRPSFDIILESPLDDLPPRRGLHPALAFAVAAAVGAVTTVGVASAFDDGAPAATPATTTTTVTSEPAEVSTELVLDDGTRIEQLRWWSGDDSLTVLVTAAVRPGADPSETDPVTSGYWELVTSDGRTAVGRVSSDVGVSMIEFGGPGIDETTAALLRYSPPATTFERDIVWTEDAVSFPWRPPIDGPLASADGAAIVIDSTRFDDMGGEIVWHLETDGRHRATLDVTVDYREEGRAERIVSRYGLPAAFLQLEAADLVPIDGATLELYHLDDPEEPTFRSRFWGDPDPVDVDDVVVRWTIVIAGYSGEPVEASVSIGS